MCPWRLLKRAEARVTQAQEATTLACQRGIDAEAAPEDILQADPCLSEAPGRCAERERERGGRAGGGKDLGGREGSPGQAELAELAELAPNCRLRPRSERLLSVKKEAMGAGEGARHVKREAGVSFFSFFPSFFFSFAGGRFDGPAAAVPPELAEAGAALAEPREE